MDMDMGLARSDHTVKVKTLTAILESKRGLGWEREGKEYAIAFAGSLAQDWWTGRDTYRMVDSTWCNTLFVTKSVLFRRITSAHATCLCGVSDRVT